MLHLFITALFVRRLSWLCISSIPGAVLALDNPVSPSLLCSSGFFCRYRRKPSGNFSIFRQSHRFRHCWLFRCSVVARRRDDQSVLISLTTPVCCFYGEKHHSCGLPGTLPDSNLHSMIRRFPELQSILLSPAGSGFCTYIAAVASSFSCPKAGGFFPNCA